MTHLEPDDIRIVGFAGPKYSGKDTAAKQLLCINDTRKKYLFERLMMAEGAKQCASITFDIPMEVFEDPVLKEQPLDRWPSLCPRQLVIDVANWYRAQYGGEVWANRWERNARKSWYKGTGCFLITDMRFPEEVEMLKRNKGLLIYVQRDEAEEALLKAQYAGDQMANNVSESHYDMLKREADATVDNNGTLAHLAAQTLSVVRNHYGYWGFWENIEEKRNILDEMRMGTFNYANQ